MSEYRFQTTRFARPSPVLGGPPSGRELPLLNWLGILALCACVSGCASFYNDDDAMDAYRRGVERPIGVRGVGQDPTRSVRPVSYEEEEGKQDPLTMDDFAPGRLPTTLQRLAGNGPDREEAEAGYREAETIYNDALAAYERVAAGRAPNQISPDELDSVKDRFAEAGSAYLRASKDFPNSRLAHDALFQSGEAYFFADRFAKANETYEMVLAKYPGTRHLDRIQTRRFAIAHYWLQLDELNPDNFLTYNLLDARRPRRDTDGHAMRILDKIRLDDPTGRLADDATMALGNAYFAQARFLDAADTYEDLRKAYPGSPHLYTAMLLEIRARLEAYRGADYDGTGLARSEQLLEQAVKQFPDKVAANREVLDELAGQVRFSMAERDYTLAQLYERRSEYRAARLHYQLVIDEYSETTLADLSRERMAEIADLPDLPPQRMQWLVDLLPKPRDERPIFTSRAPR
ncbi:MAG: outer membrane protein assembly factor BamD [Pirellulaceae bacterium]